MVALLAYIDFRGMQTISMH